MIFLLGHSV